MDLPFFQGPFQENKAREICRQCLGIDQQWRLLVLVEDYYLEHNLKI